MKRVLIGKTNQHMTDGIMTRRAKQIAKELGSDSVDITIGSEPNHTPWVFTFRSLTGKAEPELVLECSGTRGMVYTALGNYLAGLEFDYEG